MDSRDVVGAQEAEALRRIEAELPSMLEIYQRRF
jgi:hypothetical protein